MRKLLKNKKAEKYLSVYWFAILAIVAVGISVMVIIFYGKPFDIREAEAEILINKIADCISSHNILKENITNEDFLEKCNLIIDEEYYLEINSLGIGQGNLQLKDYCNAYKTSVVCMTKGVYLLKDNKDVWIDISVIINKDNENEE